MNIILARTAGFCFGVQRAVDTVYEQIGKKRRPIYTYGPIIHNEEVVRDLAEKGVTVITDLSELERHEKGVMIIRSHGVSESELRAIEAAGYEVINATCPFVSKIHRAVQEHAKKGYHIVIIGNANHPEVEGIRGWCLQAPVDVIETDREAEAFTAKERKLCIVSQTTFRHTKFQELVEIIQKKGYDSIVLNTICNATEERQLEAEEIASGVDAMIVIGGKGSSNTQKLYEICRNHCPNAYYIQTKNDLGVELLHGFEKIGITAGASTPKNIIEEVQNYVRNEF